MAETLMTQLDAVNKVLATIGESPVNSLAGALPADVQTAFDVLTETSRDVQMDGWGFNQEYDITFSPDIISGNITLPGNCLDARLTRWSTTIDPVQRGTNLYDRKNHTYVFKLPVKLNIIYFLSWDELPEQARRYIMVKSARVFQVRVLGSETLNGFTEKEEMIALSKLKDSDDENTDYSIFGNYDTASIIMRGGKIA